MNVDIVADKDVELFIRHQQAKAPQDAVFS